MHFRRWRTRRGVAILAGGAALVLVVALVLVEVWPRSAGGWAIRDPGPPPPFAGTPAESFAEQSGAILLPPARTLPDAYVAGYQPRYEDVPAPEVTEALDAVRRALVATRVDPAMLVDHDPARYIATQAPILAEQWGDEVWPASLGFRSPEWARRWVTRLAEDATLAAPPRAVGEVSYEATVIDWPPDLPPPNQGVEITTRFVWAYAFEAAPGERADLVVIRDEQTWWWPTDFRIVFVPGNRGIHHVYERSAVAAWGVDCEAWAAGLISPAVDPGPLPAEAYDPATPLPDDRPDC